MADTKEKGTTDTTAVAPKPDKAKEELVERIQALKAGGELPPGVTIIDAKRNDKTSVIVGNHGNHFHEGVATILIIEG